MFFAFLSLKYQIVKKFIAILTIITVVFAAFAAGEWSLEKDKNGIKIYTRRSESSKLKEFKGIMTIKGSPDQVAAILKDVSQHDKIMFKCRAGTAKVIKKVSDNEFYTYMEIDSPWPASDRDVITLYKFSKGADGIINCQIKAFPEMMPEKKGFVRVPKTEGYWKMEPLTGGMVRVTNQALSEPGGSVPDGLANSAAVDAPYYMLNAIKGLLGG